MTTATPCSSVGGSTVIFVARVIQDSGEGFGKGPARVSIEEALQNVPVGQKEAVIQTSAGNSCYYRLKKGERYVIITNGKNYSVASCTSSFSLRGSEHILDALRNQVKGGQPKLVGRVIRRTTEISQPGVPNALVVAETAGRRYESRTDGKGTYSIPGLPPGRYRMDVTAPGYVPDEEFNLRWSGTWFLNPATNVVEPANDPPGSAVVSARSCAIKDLAMWPEGSKPQPKQRPIR